MLAPVQNLSDDEPHEYVPLQNVDRLSDSEELPAGGQLVPAELDGAIDRKAHGGQPVPAELDEPIDRKAPAKPNKKRKLCPTPLNETSLK